MPWSCFLASSVAGSAAWAMAVGLGTFLLGRQPTRLSGTASLVILAAAAVGILGVLFALHRAEAHLAREAERAPPDGGALSPTNGHG